ncbi:MAG TPA: alkaline phosphatase PhoX, partial [Ilumatobacteraceae bacterium]
MATTSLVGAADGRTPGVDLGFTPITTPAKSCSVGTGVPIFAKNLKPKQLMAAFDSATPVNAPATANHVGTENDMIALSPDGHYLYTPSEAGASDGVTRLTLTSPGKGTKELLSYNPVAGGTPVWSRIDGAKWYPHGGPGTHGVGVVLVSEEFATGGIWQINPDTGAFVRLSWLGNFSHEGIGLDTAGNLYLGDENRGGAIYKAVPTDVNDLTAGGTLYYMVGTGTDATGWKTVTDPVNAITEANSGGAILFDRPEDFDELNGRVYFAVTEPKGDADPRKGTYAPGGDTTKNQVVNRGGVYSVNAVGVPDLAVQSGSAPYAKLVPMIEVQDPTYANQAAANAQQGLQFPDNITFDGRGHLWVHEDIPDSSAPFTFPASGIDVSKQTRDQQDELYV